MKKNTHPAYQFFKLSEFESKDANGKKIKGTGAFMQPSFLKMLDTARGLAGISFRITSGFRTPEHNRRVRGATNSAHTRGFAADIATDTDEQFETIAAGCFLAGFRRFGVMQSALHVDCDPALKTPALWDYDGAGDAKRVAFIRGMFAGNNIEI